MHPKRLVIFCQRTTHQGDTVHDLPSQSFFSSAFDVFSDVDGTLKTNAVFLTSCRHEDSVLSCMQYPVRRSISDVVYQTY